MTETIRFFLPGPSYVLERVRQAMSQYPIGHRGADFKAINSRIAERLPQVFRTSRQVVIATGSGSIMWDMAALGLVESDVLNLVNGAFSDRFHSVCKAWGRNADKVEVPMGRVVDPDLLRQTLRRKRYEAVSFAHNETSTGVLNPLEDLVKVVREESDALVLVDAVSSLAGARVEAEAWDIDFLFTASQKALAVPPGLAMATLSERAVAKLGQTGKTSPRGYYVDLERYWKKQTTLETVTTPAIPQFWALDAALEVILEEGMEARWQRHLELRAQTAAWAASRGFEYASEEAGASPTVSTLRPPAGVDAQDLVKRLRAEGYVIGGGYQEWKASTVRIGHMGEVRATDLDELFGVIDRLTAG
jgi:predicted phosphoserine aminotransferase